jgi:hypothetical protein
MAKEKSTSQMIKDVYGTSNVPTPTSKEKTTLEIASELNSYEGIIDVKTIRGLPTPLDIKEIAHDAVEEIRKGRLLDITNIKNGETLAYLAQNKKIDTKDLRWHGAGDTVVAGSGITITTTATGTKSIAATGGGVGTVTSVSVTTANGISGTVATATTTPAISLDISALDATKIANGTVTSTEFQYLGSVTSDIQTQINTKAPTASPTFTGTITTPLTASRAVVTGASSELAIATTTATEIGYVNGVTSAIQTQMDLKSPLASPTFTGTVTLPTTQLQENGAVLLDASLSADGKYSGIAEAGTAGEALVFGNTVYFKAADSRWYLTDADADATAGAVKIGICVLAAAGVASATTILLFGKINAASLFPALTVGAPVYLSTTGGAVQTTQPSGTDDVIRIVGYGNTGDELYWSPSNDYLTHT